MKTNSHLSHPVSVATFDRRPDADSLKDLLEQQGVEAAIQDETRLQRYWFHAEPKAGIHVLVARDQFEKTDKLFAQKPFSAPLQKAVHCPSCGSVKVQYPALTRKNILPSLIALVLVWLHIKKHKYYCEDCHYTWPHKGQVTGEETTLL